MDATQKQKLKTAIWEILKPMCYISFGYITSTLGIKDPIAFILFIPFGIMVGAMIHFKSKLDLMKMKQKIEILRKLQQN